MRWMDAAAAAMLCASLALVPASARQASGPGPGAQQASGDARRMARWVVQSRDHRGLPFAVVDKKNARIHVFDRAGRLRGSSTVLLGQAAGDVSAPGVGRRAQTGKVRPHERITPAGRFASEPGRNLRGEHVVWMDYESAFAIHRLRAGASRSQRQARLASATPRDNRASLGCVVVPVRFYLEVVSSFLGQGRAMVYVLPEPRRVTDMPEVL